MSDINPKVGAVLRECELGADAAWKHGQSGKWIVCHWALEVVAAYKGIKYDAPQFLVAEPRAAVVVVTGHLEERSEWSVGEAVIDLNYKVTGKQQGYPFAMAEKRAKDRVILKLVGLHGYAYSESESDDFEAPKPATAKDKQQEASRQEDNPFGEPEKTPAEKACVDLHAALEKAGTMKEFQEIWADSEDNRHAFPENWQAALKEFYTVKRRTFKNET